MKIKQIIRTVVVTSLFAPILFSCGETPSQEQTSKYFNYEDISFVDRIGESTNNENYNYESLKVNKVENELREDFAFGVDASMTHVVEQNGGIYYNQNGEEQDLFQILRKSGVNFARFRLWNNPESKLHKTYGGGGNSTAVDIELARRAKRANMNVLIDFHYSDFWADPDKQQAPREWAALAQDKIPEKIKEFTISSLQQFKDEGITVDAVQIGNEINNGLAGYSIDWNNAEQSYTTMSEMLKKGIEGAKEVFPEIKTIIHLANGGNKDEFESFFVAMNNRKVNYDIIGASYYPHLSGSMNELQANLDNVSKKTGKPVMVVETSWGYTDDYNEYTANSYSSDNEDAGGYLTSVQAQATSLRDITNILSKVPDNKGLGIFYWEPGWLPVKNAGWATASGQSYAAVGDDSMRNSFEDGLATWSNQGLFSYTGKALPSLNTFKYLREGHNETFEEAVKARHTSLDVTLNVAVNESLPLTGKVETNLDAIRERPIAWTNEALEAVKTKGVHTNLSGLLDDQYPIKYNANCIENYIVDPGFELQGEGDVVTSPWVIEYSTPSGDKVIKLDRKSDTRSGRTDLNWYHSNKECTFKVSQEIKNMPQGTYTLSTYLMGEKMTTAKHDELTLFIQINGGTPIEYDAKECILGWTAGYQKAEIKDIEILEGATIKVGLVGKFQPRAWAHNDDWELIKTN